MPVDPRIQAILAGPLTTPTDLRFAPLAGHVQPPGTGPIGETCNSCRHCHPVDCAQSSWICDLERHRLGYAGASISRLEDACGRWSAARP